LAGFCFARILDAKELVRATWVIKPFPWVILDVGFGGNNAAASMFLIALSTKRAISDCLVKLLFLYKNVENLPVPYCPFYGRTDHGYEIVSSFEFGVNLPSGNF